MISSPTTTLAKIAPGRNSKSRTSWLKTLTPVMSLGSRSGVNCTRRTEQSIERARVLASIVLPTPGTSSSSRWPSASSTVMAVRTTSGLPSMTEFIALASRPATWVTASSGAAATCGSVVRVRSASAASRVSSRPRAAAVDRPPVAPRSGSSIFPRAIHHGQRGPRSCLALAPRAAAARRDRAVPPRCGGAMRSAQPTRPVGCRDRMPTANRSTLHHPPLTCRNRRATSSRSKPRSWVRLWITVE